MAHNTAFKEGRKSYIAKLLEEKYPDQKDKKTLTSEEMSGEDYIVLFFSFFFIHYTYIIVQ